MKQLYEKSQQKDEHKIHVAVGTVLVKFVMYPFTAKLCSLCENWGKSLVFQEFSHSLAVESQAVFSTIKC